MTTILEKIAEGCKYLDSKDKKYADKFINNRDFESLYDLVKANITILQYKSDSNSAFSKLVQLMELKNTLVSYLELLGTPVEDDDEDIDSNENDNNESFFDVEDDYPNDDYF